MMAAATSPMVQIQFPASCVSLKSFVCSAQRNISVPITHPTKMSAAVVVVTKNTFSGVSAVNQLIFLLFLLYQLIINRDEK